MPHRTPRLLLTCEHASNRVPSAFRGLFAGRQRLLRSHRGWDPGALELARRLSRGLAAPLLVTGFTRLLVEPNRSEGHPRLFSTITRALPPERREAILERYYRPHWRKLEGTIRTAADKGAGLLHIAVHSFTAVLDGKVRDVDVGLLYDPARSPERDFARRWRSALLARRPDLRVRCNAPYKGVSDAITTAMRRRFPARRYAGIELEVNQRFVRRGRSWHRLGEDLLAALAATLEAPPERRDGKPARLSRPRCDR